MHKYLAGERAFAATQYGKEREYWLDKLSGELEKVGFPPDIHAPGSAGTTPSAVPLRFPRDIFERFTTISGGSHSRMHMLLVTGITLLVYKYTGHSDIVIGTPIDKQEVEGDFVNTILALRNRLEEGMTVRDLLMQVKQAVIEARENQNYPLETIPYELNMPVDDDDFPLFDTAVLLQNIQDKRYIEHLKLNVLFSFHNTGESMEGEVEYNPSLYEEATIREIVDRFFNLARGAFSRVDLKLTETSLLSEQEREDILFGFNDTAAEYSRDKTMHLLFEEQVEKTPGNTAVICDGKSLTYRELNEGANKLAWELKKKGVKPNCFVAVIIGRSIEMVMGVMAILKAGGAYVPLEPYLPEARMLAGLSSLNATCLLTDCAQLNKVDRVGKEMPGLKHVFCLDDTRDITGPGSLLEDKQLIFPGELRENSMENPAPSAAPTDIAYVIFTSGTTGTPKGVVEKHRPVINIIEWVNKTFNVSASDKLLFVASLGFDLSVYDIFGILAAGASIRVVKSEDIRRPDRLLDIILEEGITFWDSAPAALQLLVPYLPGIENDGFGGGKSRLRLVFLSGDWIPVTMPDALKEAFDGVNVIALGGATEATIWSNYYPIGTVDPDWKSIPYGKPIQNAAYYVLDPWLEPRPIGVPGDLFIGGECLASGYINDEVLTAKKFIDNPFVPGEKMYRTGDMARWFPDGNMEFLGRRDNQVKIRGFRIELGEIETQLLAHDEITEAVASVKENDGNKYLCAYYVADRELKAVDLSGYLARTLPEYMIPSYFIKMDRMPLTPNGKLDRKGLPGPRFGFGEKEYAAPRDAVEKKLVEIWSGILKVEEEKIGIDSNFFELGGHSLNATIMASNIHKEMNVKLPLLEIFSRPSIRFLSEWVKNAETDTFSAIEQVESRDYYELSSAQERLYVLQQMELDNTGYNINIVIPLYESAPVEKLEETFKKLIHRHENFKTSFEMLDDRPIQRIHDKVEFSMERFEVKMGDGAGSAGREQRDKEIQQVINGFVRSFELNHPPLIRAGLLSVEGSGPILVVDVHHIVCDGTSLEILQEDFIALLEGRELDPLHLQYRDFSTWQNSLSEFGRISAQRDYWSDLYAGELPKLELAADHPRPAAFTFEGDSLSFVVGAEDTRSLRELSIKNDATLFMNLLTIFYVLLHKYSGQEDIVVGTGVAGRPHADLQRVIGMFVNMLALRGFPEGNKPYDRFLAEVKNHCIDGFENQDVQFEDLVDKLVSDRDPSRNPIFDVTLVVQNYEKYKSRMSEIACIVPPPDRGEHLDAARYGQKLDTSKFDMTLFVFEVADELHCTLEYYTGLFKRETIERFVEHFFKVVHRVLENPGAKLFEIDIISEEEKKTLLFDFNKTAADFPADKTIHELFEEQVEKIPDTTALVYEDSAISYRELDRRANRLAHYLHLEREVHVGTPVGILMERSIEQIAVLIGILKAGGAYLPLDPSLPETRLKDMIDDAEVEAVISSERFVRMLNRLQWECRSFNAFLCPDSHGIYLKEESETNGLMDEKLWDYVAESSVDDITGGGWLTGYTGEPFTREEMDEYGDNILKKLTPLLHEKMKVLEIGCGSGISMYRIAPRVGSYYGTDLSRGIIERNEEQIREKGLKNIFLSHLPAHGIEKIAGKDFDLVIINSVIQSFPGHNYFRKVIGKSVDLLKDSGYLFIGDVMDRDLKEALTREMTAFKYGNKPGSSKTKTDWSSELFLSRAFFEDLSIEFPAIGGMEFSRKIYTVENELTKFRYDVLVTVDKSKKESKRNKTKRKYQHDFNTLAKFPVERAAVPVGPGDPAYVIYTSGSTGKSKGVMVEHKNVSRLVKNSNYMDYINFTGDDRFLLTGSLAFDISTFEIWGMLLNDPGLVMVDKGTVLDTERLKETAAKHRISVIHFIPQLFQEIAAHCPEIFKDIKCLLVGGDVVRPAVINPLRNKYRHLKILHMYGPTESTTFSTFFPIDKDYETNIPIGKPIGNTAVYILDKCNRLQPVGIPGELCIGGYGVARGYLNRQELTAEKFSRGTAHLTPLPHYPSTPIYRTGDRARWLPDGNIEFLGRIDHQVKIRGIRLELGEIENRLLQKEEIKEAVAVVKEDERGDRSLYAYIVSESEVDIPELGRYLAKYLPDYMIPSHFVPLESIPLNPNGKIDRKSLPDPELKIEGEYIGPRNQVEKTLVEIWSGLLGLEKGGISIDANFFDLGGHSLKATAMAAVIHKALNVRLPLAEVFRTPTVRGIAGTIMGLTMEKYASVEPAEVKTYYALSPGQRRFYIMQQMELESTGYNLPIIVKVRGDIDRKRFEETFKKLIARHEVLRTSFELVGGEPVQRVRETVDFKLDYREIGGGEPSGGEKQVDETITNFVRPFDLSKSPLLRAALIKWGEEHILMVDKHHIISDGMSQGILVDEFTTLYGGEEPAPLRLQYKDYSEWQNNRKERGALKQQEEYWLREFDGELPSLNLPYDFAPPGGAGFSGETRIFQIPGHEAEELKKLAVEEGTTLFMVLLAAFNILLSRLTGQEDIIVGTPTAGRHHADLQPLIGMFVNTIPLRNYPGGDRTFVEFLEDVKMRTLEAFENQDYPFEELLDALPVPKNEVRNPLFKVFFGSHDIEDGRKPGRKMAGLEIEHLNPGKQMIVMPFDLGIGYVVRDAVNIHLDYSPGFFLPSTIEKIKTYYIDILKQAAQDKRTKLKDFEIAHDLLSVSSTILDKEENDFVF